MDAPQVRRAPRLVVRVMAFSFAVTVGVLSVSFVVLTWQAQRWLTRAVTESLEQSQRRFAGLQARRSREHLLQAVTLAENPTLKAALDTYNAERATGTPAEQLAPTIGREIDKLQQLLNVAALSVLDVRGQILASAGHLRSAWPVGERLDVAADGGADGGAQAAESIVTRGGIVFLVTTVPMALGDDVIGTFVLADPLDDAYARELVGEAGTDIAVIVGGQVVASSATPAVRDALEQLTIPDSGSLAIGDEVFVVRRLSSVDAARVYALGSVTKSATASKREAASALALSGLGSLLLAALGSTWLAQALARPVGELTSSLARMSAARDLTHALPRSGVSREFDELADTFDLLRAELSKAEDESEDTYLGVIGTLANALDARDPYTAGHSTRVANLSVVIGRQMRLPDDEVESLRLGALLHDIGKIGVSDSVLRKPGRLTDEEFAQIKLHPTLGSRILKPLRILSAQVAIVELHHERPDGRGYPHGLSGAEIPLAASIVHVADAFDAITSARAYRPRRPAAEAMAEILRCAGSDFDPAVVRAIAALPMEVLIRISLDLQPTDGRTGRGLGSIEPFRMRPARPVAAAVAREGGPHARVG
jgi:HD-GYP domain-containing protein (c-di-GMP phosphodiesterase class II)